MKTRECLIKHPLSKMRSFLEASSRSISGGPLLDNVLPRAKPGEEGLEGGGRVFVK